MPRASTIPGNGYVDKNGKLIGVRRPDGVVTMKPQDPSPEQVKAAVQAQNGDDI